MDSKKTSPISGVVVSKWENRFGLAWYSPRTSLKKSIHHHPDLGRPLLCAVSDVRSCSSTSCFEHPCARCFRRRDGVVGRWFMANKRSDSEKFSNNLSRGSDSFRMCLGVTSWGPPVRLCTALALRRLCVHKAVFPEFSASSTWY
jgi:hypothetical protein